MFVLGLTGSIAMGKSTTAQMFADFGIPVHDADGTVHRLYSGKAAQVVEELFPGTTANGVVDRQLLSRRVMGQPAALRRLEKAIHPLVREEELEFLASQRAKGSDLVVLDIPLLFETGAQNRVDGVVVVTAPAAVQRRRALERPDMTEEKFAQILSRQVPDADKRERADFIVDTSLGLEQARNQVARIVETIRTRIQTN